ncbi:MAG: CoA protein activase [Syntrophomonadaceae bacterium]|nr:CoA protein activase [Syntrophomonadaceae bacterium]
MKITFPHMGFMHIPLKSLLQGLHREVVVPPPISERTLALGVKYAPEFACLPLKIGLGNYIEALEAGADTILMAGGWGPCRFGYYAQVQRDILRDLGYDFHMVILEAPDSRLSQLLHQLKQLGEKVSFMEAIEAIRFAWYKLAALEKAEEHYLYVLPRSSEKEEAERIWEDTLVHIDQAQSRKAIDGIVSSAIKAWNCLEQHSQPILRIGLVGEVYTVLEPYSNQHIIRSLGRLNAEVTNSIKLTEWLNDHLFKGHLLKSRQEHIVDCARPYLASRVGGHGLETVGTTVDFAHQGYDGVIQIGPLTCMPEIVAQSILLRVAKEEQIPCMTLYFDEHSANAGITTRLEAFTDMLRRRKAARVNGSSLQRGGSKSALLSGG